MRLKVSAAVKAELGAERCRWRRRIQEVMDRHGITSAKTLAEIVGVSGNAAYRTLAGTLHTPEILEKLRELGVPEEYLCDPRKHGKEAA